VYCISYSINTVLFVVDYVHIDLPFAVTNTACKSDIDLSQHMGTFLSVSERVNSQNKHAQISIYCVM
jgi:hypothetical protein